MNVQIARGSGVATITLSEAELRRFLAQSRVIVDDMRRALREAMEQPAERRASRRNPREHTFPLPGLRRRSTSYGAGPSVGKRLVSTRNGSSDGADAQSASAAAGTWGVGDPATLRPISFRRCPGQKCTPETLAQHFGLETALMRAHLSLERTLLRLLLGSPRGRFGFVQPVS